MTVCVIHQDHEAEEGWLCCRRAWGRLAGSLRRIPELCEELAGLGYVQRDTRSGLRRELQRLNEKTVVVELPGPADPVAHALPSGPLNGSRNGARVSGSPSASTPIRIDPTDLLARPRHASLFVADRSPWPEDQIGYLGAAARLGLWVRDWAFSRGESVPETGGERSPVSVLCSWLLDRLDWACRYHFALDEFAADVQKLSSELYGQAGHGASRPKLMEAACRRCGLMTLIQPYPDANIECTNVECQNIDTPEEYAEYVNTLIEENTP